MIEQSDDEIMKLGDDKAICKKKAKMLPELL